MKSSIFTFTAAILLSLDAIAQDGKLLDIDIDLNRQEWYENPWVWVGGAAFLLIVLLILRRPKK